MSLPDSPFEADDRGVSPVIGVVLMIAIFVILMAAVGAFVLGFSPTQSPPDTEMAFVEEGAGGVGVQVVMDIGDNVEADNLAFQLDDGTSCEEWRGADRVETGDETILAYCEGDDLNEGDTVQVIWSDHTGSRSTIVDSYEMRGTADLADYNCDELDLESGDATVETGETVACQIGSPADREDVDLTIEDGGKLIGDVYFDGGGSLDHDEGGEIGGDVDVVGGVDVDLDEESRIDGDVVGDGDTDVDLDDDSEVTGSVVTDGDVTLDEEDTGSGIGGDVDANDVDLDGQSRVDGDVTAQASVDIDDGGEVRGDVLGRGPVDVDDSDVTGTVLAEGDITLGSGATIQGDAISESSVDDDDGTVEGEVKDGVDDIDDEG